MTSTNKRRMGVECSHTCGCLRRGNESTIPRYNISNIARHENNRMLHLQCSEANHCGYDQKQEKLRRRNGKWHPPLWQHKPTAQTQYVTEITSEEALLFLAEYRMR